MALKTDSSLWVAVTALVKLWSCSWHLPLTAVPKLDGQAVWNATTGLCACKRGIAKRSFSNLYSFIWVPQRVEANPPSKVSFRTWWRRDAMDNTNNMNLLSPTPSQEETLGGWRCGGCGAWGGGRFSPLGGFFPWVE